MESNKQQIALTEREMELYNKEIKARKNQLLGILKQRNRFSNDINGIPNGIVTVRQNINITLTSSESI